VDQPDNDRRPVWPWTKHAVKAFVTAATQRGQRFHIPSGLDAALMVDLPDLCQALTRFRIDLLTGENIAPRVLTLVRPKEGYTINDETGQCTIKLRVTRKLLLDLLALQEIPDDLPDGAEMPADPSTNGATPPAPETPHGG
jgi:hypothetical protein